MTSSIATIYIPYADYHRAVAQRAIESAIWQTVDCDVICEPSPRTPANLRNKAMYAQTPFVVFLDADDYLLPTFVEDCLRFYEQGYYVYTSWYQGDFIMRPRAKQPYLAHDFQDGEGLIGGYHLVTTLFPRVLFAHLAGFDVELSGMEDTDFYMRAHNEGICGLLCDKPLLKYNDTGQTRSKQFREQADYHDLRRMIYERNGGVEAMANGCCGISSGSQAASTVGEQPGDIPVQTLYAPATQFGRVTGRFYMRPFFTGQTIMVAPEDAKAMPEFFRPIENLRQLAPTREQVLKDAGLV